MTYFLLGGLALLALAVGWQYFRKADISRLVGNLRWVVGGSAALITVLLLVGRQVGLATMTGAAAFSILRFGRIGPFDFNKKIASGDNVSEVKSSYFTMLLDHGTGEVAGKVVTGEFRGRDLMELDEFESRRLLDEVAGDSDSLALLETWLDRNRTGWREYFAGQGESGPGATETPADDDETAYEILGLEPGASEEDIRAAHRNLMKGVHPDQGGSNYLASRINWAKDRLLRKRK